MLLYHLSMIPRQCFVLSTHYHSSSSASFVEGIPRILRHSSRVLNGSQGLQLAVGAPISHLTAHASWILQTVPPTDLHGEDWTPDHKVASTHGPTLQNMLTDLCAKDKYNFQVFPWK